MKKSTLTTILFAAFAIIFQVFETKAAPDGAKRQPLKIIIRGDF